MSLEQGKIGHPQLVLLMMGYIIGPAIVIGPGAQANQDAWIALLLSIFEGVLLFLMGVILNIRFKGKNLAQINEIVFGPYLSKLMSLAYLWYLFHIGSLVLATFKDFFLITTLPQTPEIITTAIVILVCAYAVKNGLEVIARCGQILVFASIAAFLGSTLLLLKDIDLNNLLPILETPAKKLFMTVHESAVFLFGDTIVFLMVIPYLDNKSNKRTIKSVITAFLISGLFITFVSIRNIGVLGPMNGIFLYPTFQTDRLINIGNLLTRLEILTVTGFITMGFINLSTLLYATALGGAQLFGLRTYRPLILPISILMTLLALLNFRNVFGNLAFAQQIYPVYALPFQVGIPLVTLIVASIRKLPKE